MPYVTEKDIERNDMVHCTAGGFNKGLDVSKSLPALLKWIAGPHQ